jgi:DNA-binding PadR family transcriptional regulator
MHYMALYRKIRKVHKKIAMKTFNSCIKDLKAKGLIATEDVNGRGKKIDHFLTNKGKQHVKLLLGNHENQSDDKSIERREKLSSVYLIILYTILQDHTYTIGSEREFKDFLSKNNLTSKELIQLPQNEENKMGEIIPTTVFRHISGIRISKIETSNSKDKGTVYKCSLPGLSVTDVLLSDNIPVFGYIKTYRI